MVIKEKQMNRRVIVGYHQSNVQLGGREQCCWGHVDRFFAYTKLVTSIGASFALSYLIIFRHKTWGNSQTTLRLNGRQGGLDEG